MNKIVLSVVSVFAFVGTLFAASFPGWGCNDAAVWKQALKEAKTNNEKATCMMMLAVSEQKIRKFDQLCAIVDKVCDELFANPKENADKKLEMKKMFARNRGQFVNEAFVFAKSNPSWYDYYLCLIYKGDRADCYSLLYSTLKNYFYYYTPEVHVAALDLLSRCAKEGNVTTLKQDIAGFRKHYEHLVQKNKKWEVALNKFDAITK